MSRPALPSTRNRPSTRAAERLAELTAAGRADAVLRDPDVNRLQMQDFHRGLPVSVIAQIFRMDVSTVKRRLADCPPKESRKSGYLYDLAQASQYLVKPVFDVQKYMATMKPSDMPATLQQAYWDAALKRQKWEENAGDLWRTVDVQTALSEVFQMIKQTIQLWPESIREEMSVTDKQREALVSLGDVLQEEIYKGLVENVKAKKTRSTASEMDAAPIDSDALELV